MKFSKDIILSRYFYVTTCVVVWIEIASGAPAPGRYGVTTCVVVWIEIPLARCCSLTLVTTCVVVWIEI